MLNPETERLFAYHEATKHTRESVRRSRHMLDWANMPYPFRHYEGVPVVDLPADPPPPRAPALEVLLGEPAAQAHPDAAGFLSGLLFYSAAISASKRVPQSGYRYSLRVNPSSGNLHPTEFHFAARGLAGWQDGLYHYRPSSHMAELRARGDWVSKLAGRDARLVFVLTSIAWREAWKYRSRAYRYCLHDIGHAWQSLEMAARAMGCEAFARGHFGDGGVTEALGVIDEWPMLIVEISQAGLPLAASPPAPDEWLGGAPNRLSEEVTAYPLIDAIHAASSLESGGEATRLRRANRQPATPLPPSAPLGEVVRRRRSALDFEGGARTISRLQLDALLDAACRPLESDFGDGLVQLYLYVHRVDGLEPGVYRDRELIKRGDQRVMAAALSLSQDLAGNSCVTFSMIADLDRAARVHGNRGYRYVHFEAGAIGQRLYLAAESMGFQSTGIGAFYDDEVHAYLEIPRAQGQVIYHFACGYAVSDDRLDA